MCLRGGEAEMRCQEMLLVRAEDHGHGIWQWHSRRCVTCLGGAGCKSNNRAVVDAAGK